MSRKTRHDIKFNENLLSASHNYVAQYDKEISKLPEDKRMERPDQIVFNVVSYYSNEPQTFVQ